MLVEFIQKCLPIRLKNIHIVKQSFLFNMVFAIFKPLLEVHNFLTAEYNSLLYKSYEIINFQ